MVKAIKKVLNVLLVVIPVMVWPAQTFAISQAQKDAFSSGILYFNTESSTSCAIDVGANLSGNGNIQKAFNFFVQKFTNFENNAMIKALVYSLY